MGIICKETFSSREPRLWFEYKIGANAAGRFYTMIPTEHTKLMDEAGVVFDHKGRGYGACVVKGYLESDTKRALINRVNENMEKALSKSLADERIVIQYDISSTMAYATDDVTGEILPTTYFDKQMSTPRLGIDNRSSENRQKFDISISAAVFVKRTFSLSSGEDKIDYALLRNSEFGREHLKKSRTLRWLSHVCYDTPGQWWSMQEIDYTEKRGNFFIQFISGLCSLNEAMRGMLDPEEIIKIADSGGRFLQAPKQGEKEN